MTQQNLESYIKSWSLELSAKSNRIRFLIGDAHWATDGAHNESVLKSFLRQYSPKALEVGSGFIRLRGDNAIVTPQIDILVINTHSYVPLYSEGDLFIADPSSALAYLEVKSTFNKTNCKAALKHVRKVQEIIQQSGNNHQIWSGIFFNNTSMSKEDQKNKIFESLQEVFADNPADIGTLLPNCVIVNSSATVFVSPQSLNPSCMQASFFETEDLSLACALSDLLKCIGSPMGMPDLESAIESLNIPTPEIKILGEAQA